MCRFLQKGKPASLPALYRACFGCFVASAYVSEWCEFHEFPIHMLYLFFHQGICLFIELSEVLFCSVLFNSEGRILLHRSQSSGVKQSWVWIWLSHSWAEEFQAVYMTSLRMSYSFFENWMKQHWLAQNKSLVCGFCCYCFYVVIFVVTPVLNIFSEKNVSSSDTYRFSDP